MAFKDLLFGFLLAGLFLFAMISFGVQTAQDNTANKSIIDDSRVNLTYTRLSGNLSASPNTANASRTGFETELPTASFGGLIFFSIVSTGRVLGSMVSNVFNITFGFLGDVLGVPAIVLGIFSTIVLVMIILTVWRLIKVGE